MHVTDTNSSHSKGLKLFLNINLQVRVPGSTFEMQGSSNWQESFSRAKRRIYYKGFKGKKIYKRGENSRGYFSSLDFEAGVM